MGKVARIILSIPIAATLATAFAACTSSPGAATTPALTSVSPNQGCQGQSLTVTIGGANLDGAKAVSFGGGIDANSFTVDSSGTQITANITIDSGCHSRANGCLGYRARRHGNAAWRLYC